MVVVVTDVSDELMLCHYVFRMTSREGDDGGGGGATSDADSGCVVLPMLMEVMVVLIVDRVSMQHSDYVVKYWIMAVVRIYQ